MIAKKEIERLIDADFEVFTKGLKTFDKPGLIEVRKYLQPIFEAEKAKKGKERPISTGYYKKLYFVKSLISKRSRGALFRRMKKIKEKNADNEGTFFAIDIETFDVYSARSKDAVQEKARSDKPDAYLFVFPIGERYETILK